MHIQVDNANVNVKSEHTVQDVSQVICISIPQNKRIYVIMKYVIGCLWFNKNTRRSRSFERCSPHLFDFSHKYGPGPAPR